MVLDWEDNAQLFRVSSLLLVVVNFWFEIEIVKTVEIVKNLFMLKTFDTNLCW